MRDDLHWVHYKFLLIFYDHLFFLLCSLNIFRIFKRKGKTFLFIFHICLPEKPEAASG